MYKEIMKNILETSSAELTKEEIQDILDSELNKNEDEMDTELIELCIEALNREDDSAEVSCENSKGNIKLIRHRKIKKIFIIAAVISVILIISFTVGANIFNVDAKPGVVKIFGNIVSIDLEALENKETESNNYEEFKDTYLFPVFGSESCILKEKENSDKTIRFIEFYFKDSGISGYINIEKNSIYDFISDKYNFITRVEQIKQTEIDGVDTLILSTVSMGSEIIYVANNDYYHIRFPDLTFEEALNLLKK